MAEERAPKVSMYLQFFGESFDPDAITRDLGIQPHDHGRKGELIPTRGVPRRRDRWLLHIEDRETFYIGELITDLQALVAGKESAIRQVCTDHEVTVAVECAVLQPENLSSPHVLFPADFVAWVASINGTIEVDSTACG
jgi:hypothetical protein